MSWTGITNKKIVLDNLIMHVSKLQFIIYLYDINFNYTTVITTQYIF